MQQTFAKLNKSMPLPEALNNQLLSKPLKRYLSIVDKSAVGDNMIAKLGYSQDGEESCWEMSLQFVSTDSDLITLAAYINSGEANVYAAGGNFWNSVVSGGSRNQYIKLWGDVTKGTLTKDAVLELFAAICHLLYSNFGRQGPMVEMIKQITGSDKIISGDGQNGWAKGGAIVKDGVIRLAS